MVKKPKKEVSETIIDSVQTETTKPTIKDSVKVVKVIEDKKEMVIEADSLKDFKSSIPLKFDHAIFNKLLQENVTKTGEVNYKGFIKNKTVFKQYLKILETNLPQEDWNHNEKLAYWMNVYNAYTIKLIIDNYPTKSIKDIKDAWDARFFKLGKKWYNLNDVEHKILRKMGDPRIHFGINCASYSCPPLLNKAFNTANVDKELDGLAHRFINDTKRNKISANHIQLSKIFQWFAKDFKIEGSLIDFLNKYSKTPISSNARKSYLKYNWELNE